jgi:glucans biosynthesis protein
MLRQVSHFTSLFCLLTTTAWAGNFDFSALSDKARKLSEQPYEAPQRVPEFLLNLDFHTYHSIRFKPEHSLWRESDSNFQVMLLQPGLFYSHPVSINVIDSEGTHSVPFDKNHFTYPSQETEKRTPSDLGYAGFKLTFPFTDPKVQNQFLVFAGASYFRAVGQNNNFGLSSRGLAVNTGLPSGEKFPSFVEFWLERPSPDATSMRIYGLLDGEYITGAYRFTVTPGETTRIKVKSTLFPRHSPQLLGVAPLTSMFYYGNHGGKPQGEWRPEVHDSDGLLIHDGESGEWLWHPLRNPATLAMDYFQTTDVRGFGLIQRDQSFHSYMDSEAHYQSRPSAWIEPEGQWDKGEVVLVQLPTSDETNDNIVAFWTPREKIPEKQPLDFNYTIHYGDSQVPGEPMARVVDTFVGDGARIGGGNVEGAVRIIVDFAGGPLGPLEAGAQVVSNVSVQKGGDIIEHFAEYIPQINRWRLSILARPDGNSTMFLRGFLRQNGKTLSETWTYKLP